MKPLVLYNNATLDGFLCAWVVHRVLGDNADYYNVPDEGFDYAGMSGLDLYLLDLPKASFSLLFQHKLFSRLIMVFNSSFHHYNIRRNMTAAPPREYDKVIIRSGNDATKYCARYAWEYFCPEQLTPWFIDFLEDGKDACARGTLEKSAFALPDSAAINARLAAVPHEFAAWDALEYPPRPWVDFVRQGEEMLKMQGVAI